MIRLVTIFDNLAEKVFEANAGDTLMLGPGTYKVKTPMRLKANMTIDGSHHANILFHGLPRRPAFRIHEDAPNVTIKNLNFATYKKCLFAWVETEPTLFSHCSIKVNPTFFVAGPKKKELQLQNILFDRKTNFPTFVHSAKFGTISAYKRMEGRSIDDTKTAQYV